MLDEIQLRDEREEEGEGGSVACGWWCWLIAMFVTDGVLFEDIDLQVLYTQQYIGSPA
jgi:hypothetical protein